MDELKVKDIGRRGLGRKWPLRSRSPDRLFQALAHPTLRAVIQRLPRRAVAVSELDEDPHFTKNQEPDS